MTSRAALSGLVARNGARVLDLDVLTAAEATDLLRSLIGAQADDEELTALAGRCARLPLALRIAAELVVSRPWTPVADVQNVLAELVIIPYYEKPNFTHTGATLASIPFVLLFLAGPALVLIMGCGSHTWDEEHQHVMQRFRQSSK